MLIAPFLGEMVGGELEGCHSDTPYSSLRGCRSDTLPPPADTRMTRSPFLGCQKKTTQNHRFGALK